VSPYTGARSGAGESAVNGFRVHAVGWILTANALSLRPSEARELSGLWADLVRARTEDLRRAHPLLRLLFPRSLPLSQSAWEALATLVQRMAAQHPERFGGEALRRRRDHWAFWAVLDFLLGALVATFLPKSWPFVDPMAPVFFLMGCGSLVPTLTLWRAAAAGHCCSTHHHVSWSLRRSPSSRALGTRPASALPASTPRRVEEPSQNRDKENNQRPDHLGAAA